MSALGVAILDSARLDHRFGIRHHAWTGLPMKIRDEAAVYILKDRDLIYRRTPCDFGWSFVPNVDDVTGLDWYVCNFANWSALA